MAALHAASGGIAGLKGSREYQRLPLLVPSSKAAAAFPGYRFCRISLGDHSPTSRLANSAKLDRANKNRQ
jgi:hypothetical protein